MVWISLSGPEKIMIHLRMTNRINLNTKGEKTSIATFSVPSIRKFVLIRFIWLYFKGDILLAIFKPKTAFWISCRFLSIHFWIFLLNLKKKPTMKVLTQWCIRLNVHIFGPTKVKPFEQNKLILIKYFRFRLSSVLLFQCHFYDDWYDSRRKT